MYNFFNQAFFRIKLVLSLQASLIKLVFFLLFPSSFLAILGFLALFITALSMTLVEKETIVKFLVQQQTAASQQQALLEQQTRYWESMKLTHPSKQVLFNLMQLYQAQGAFEKANQVETELLKLDPLFSLQNPTISSTD